MSELYIEYKSDGLTTSDPKIYRFRYCLTCPFWRLPVGRWSKRRSTVNVAVKLPVFLVLIEPTCARMSESCSPAVPPSRDSLNPALKIQLGCYFG